ncbi:MAG TPA: hypothetical protein P5079_12090, partial [Elusimicrobiota bacterium]|nr:hypothetical protein [Elusimicrobiota bacterium]
LYFEDLPSPDLRLRYLVGEGARARVVESGRDVNLLRAALLFAGRDLPTGTDVLDDRALAALLEGFAFSDRQELAELHARLAAAVRSRLGAESDHLAQGRSTDGEGPAELNFVRALGFLHGLGHDLRGRAPADLDVLVDTFNAARRALGRRALSEGDYQGLENGYRRGWLSGRWAWEQTAVHPFSAWGEAVLPVTAETPGSPTVDLYDITRVLQTPADQPLPPSAESLLARLADSLASVDALPTEQEKRQALGRMHVRWLSNALSGSPAEGLAFLEKRLAAQGYKKGLGHVARLAARSRGVAGTTIDTLQVYRDIASQTPRALLQILTDDVQRWTALSEEDQRRHQLRVAFLEILKDGFRIVRPLAELENAFREIQLLKIQA